MGANHHSRLCGIPQGGLDAPDDGRHREGAGHLALIGAKAPAAWRCWLQSFCRTAGSPTIAVRPEERPSSAVVSGNLTGARTEAHLGDRAMLGRIPAAMSCLSFLLVTAAPLHALARDERPVPSLSIAPRQADHARALSEMADTAARDSAKCQSSGAALGSQAYKECRALLEDKMSIENDVPPDRSYASNRGR